MKDTIWVDLDNSPHVPLFIPIINELKLRNYHVIITARDFAQTYQLLKKTDLSYKIIGKHYGKSKIAKLWGTFFRCLQLIRYIRKNKKNILLSLSHGSRSQVIASRLLSIPSYCGMDYEHTESHIFSKFSFKIWIPTFLSAQAIKDIGIDEKKVIRYPGYKEEFYIKDFVPNLDFKKLNSIPENKILVVLRPPASQANYHNEASEKILDHLVNKLIASENTYTLFLPRTSDQRIKFASLNSSHFVVLKDVLDGLNLAFYSDLLISGGGTMNREAALLGTPVYSIFSGELGDLDADMEKKGMITFLRSIEDVDSIVKIVPKSENKTNYQVNPDIVNILLNKILCS